MEFSARIDGFLEAVSLDAGDSINKNQVLAKESLKKDIFSSAIPETACLPKTIDKNSWTKLLKPNLSIYDPNAIKNQSGTLIYEELEPRPLLSADLETTTDNPGSATVAVDGAGSYIIINRID